ncbi:glycoside hydrolase family 43 protein [Dothistroma septosporum NZE10]|uniref:Glycoside hydrolase family 43 protein n=1 Tax=Dothistroma septosporum (strain NZE10 / CBS 128990) TaxID=675120 RepID=N1PCU1_DOTSN|nr:glycoside hydrolase family 43 protein [Dothistroma septosporum NZE10]
MHLSYSYQRHLCTALLLYAAEAVPTSHRLSKRAPSYDVLHGADFPDPSIINVDGISSAFGTGSGQLQVQYTSNPDFNNASGWAAPSESFPVGNQPSWAKPLTVWAPDVERLADGTFVMYYSPEITEGGLHCVGVARSATVEGPYSDESAEPWVCPRDQGGAIDASGFVDGYGTRWVLYKIDGPAVTGGGYCVSPENKPSTPIMLQQVQEDGCTKVGDPIQIWNNRGEVDRYQSEAPVIVKDDDGIYYLFYSTGCYSDSSYTTSYVTSRAITGPYDHPQVLLKNGDYGLFGPGGADVTLSGGQMVFHSLINNNITNGRAMSTATLTLWDGEVWVN